MIKKEIIKVLRTAGIEAKEEDLEIPKEEFGDIAFPCFKLAKIKKRNPKKIAEEITKKIKITEKSLIEKIEVRGGYVNFFFNWEKVSKKVLKEILKGFKVKSNKKIMVEYSQPNPVHPMHVGHARTTFLGDALANIYQFLGYKTIRANYMNDTGLQVAKLVTAYLKWGRNKKPKGKPDFWLWKYYVKFHEKAKENKKIEEEAREILRKFEIERDKKIIEVWNKIVKWCVSGFEKTYEDLGINFDIYFYESKYRDKGKKIVEKALEKGIAFKSVEGAIVADLEKYGLPSCIILRSDGTGLYITSDLGLTVYKFERYKLDKAIWVVSSQQNLYFKQLFKILELLGYKWIKNCYHFSFEHVILPEGKMSSREGRAIMLDEAIEKLSKLAYREVNKRNPKLSKKKKTEIAKKIAIGALKYFILKIEPENQITFDWNRMLKFEGDTGPYLQYTYVRCKSILRKAGKWRKRYKAKEFSIFEKRLIKEISRFYEIIKTAAKDNKPHYICNYIFSLCSRFNEFYEKVPVIKSKEKNFRLTLVWVTSKLIKQCLGLLGIQTVERM